MDRSRLVGASVCLLLAVGVFAAGAGTLTDPAVAGPAWFHKLTPGKQKAVKAVAITGAFAGAGLVVGGAMVGTIALDSALINCNYFTSWQRCALQNARDRRDRLDKWIAEQEALEPVS